MVSACYCHLHRRPSAPGETEAAGGTEGQAPPGGSKHHTCRLRSRPPCSGPPGAWGAGCLGDGRTAELGGQWENKAVLGGLIL